ncbi:type VII secretion protein EccE [Mycolicibacter arupensis]|uniref:Secretion protein EccE n=1 Tax=Mycolicibacter arupensis TaxID=342002 RepID=A0A0F5MVY3_9MYCO|nr:type VII secretion protein EccE [Mycolicibacter arupensis]KKB98759.1 secretion protein EccE [Mycolicibacter arupensis]MCV7277814.1 type VII secretion protein EccE [Mycolicibacter arupensis]OQZ93280.1 type VII secretion protein EccE [Mycolicibacter arupensis]
MSPTRYRLTGFTPSSNRRLLCAAAIALAGMAGWAVGGLVGVTVTIPLAVLVVLVPWWGQPAWSWALLWLRRPPKTAWSEPITVANNRAGGGVRIHDGVAVVAVHLLGRPHAATVATGSVHVETDNVVDVAELFPMLRHALGLELESMSVISIGARRATTGDFPRVYDAEIGTPPYAGRRETWLLLRLRVIDNTAALRWRTTLGATAVAVAQRVAGTLRCDGLRARVATASDLVELDRRVGGAPVPSGAERWKTLRTEGGWVTTYAYPARQISAALLAQAWTLPVDEVIQNITVFPDRTCTATVTLQTPQPAPTPPAVILRRLNGEQAAAVAANTCTPRPRLRGLRPGRLPAHLPIEIGPSGVLVGKLANGDRLMVPLTDSGELSRVFIAAEDLIAKRLVIRAVGAGERVCVHTRDRARWASVRMPEVSLVSESRPTPRTTVSVVDGPIAPSPRPATVITVAPPGTPPPPPDAVEVSIEQIDRNAVRVAAGGKSWLATVELFRAENRYCSSEALAPMSQ